VRHLLLSPLAAALALAVGHLGYTAHAAERLAAPPEFLSASSGEHWQAVDDDVLSHQTGKGAGGTMISGLVLQLLSQWQMPNGGSASAQGTLTVSTNANNALSAQVTTSAQASDGPGRGNGNAYGVVNGNGNANSGHGNNSATTTTAAVVTAPPAGNGGALPTVSAGTPANAGNVTADNRATGANPQATATGGQAVSVSGVSQITQVAGNGNVGANSTVIDFNSSTSTPLAGAAATNPITSAGSAPSTGTIPSTTVTTTASTNAGPNASPNAINASATATSASGNVKAGITFAGGGVAVMVQTPAGIATQTIAPANAQGSGSIAQLLQVAGNGQAVVNQLKLSVQTQPMSAALLRQSGVLQALQNSAVLRH